MTALVLITVGCSGTSEGELTSPTSLLLTVNEIQFRDEIGGTSPSNVFVEIHFKLANKLDTDIILVQDDLALIDARGNSHRYSRKGLEAWLNTAAGYALTDQKQVRRGEMAKPWVSIFDVAKGDLNGDLMLQFRNEPPVRIFVSPEG